jgi:post-segregation antitoxin (ccd killing protein)
MSRKRVSTTVDGDLLEEARRRCAGLNDASLLDEALRALLAVNRATEIDAEYARAYAEHPFDEPDEWGDLASWSAAASKT